MEYRDSKQLLLGEQHKLLFPVPADLYFEGIEITSRDLKFKTSDFATIDIDVSKKITGTIEMLEIEIKEYPDTLEGVPIEISILGTLEGVPIEISILGSFDTFYIDTEFMTEFTDDFIDEWA